MALPRFDMLPDCAISVEIFFGTSPSQAAKSRPLEHVATADRGYMALEMIGPMPGTLINRSHAGFLQAVRQSRWTGPCARPAVPILRSPSMMCSMRSDKTSVRLARMPGNSARRNRSPCHCNPRSSRKARID
jgi:hypothetical protein